MPRFAVLTALVVLLTVGGSRAATAADGTPAATPPAPSPTECRVAPRAAEELATVVGTPPAALETRPAATPLVIPTGKPASAEAVAGVTTTVEEYYACVNAGDELRQFALFTDAGLRRYVLRFTVAMPAALPRSALTPLPEGKRFFARRIRDVRVLPDGRLAATVIASNQPLEAERPIGEEALPATVFLFVAGEGRYLIDDLIFPVAIAGTPSP